MLSQKPSAHPAIRSSGLAGLSRHDGFERQSDIVLGGGSPAHKPSASGLLPLASKLTSALLQKCRSNYEPPPSKHMACREALFRLSTEDCFSREFLIGSARTRRLQVGLAVAFAAATGALIWVHV